MLRFNLLFLLLLNLLPVFAQEDPEPVILEDFFDETLPFNWTRPVGIHFDKDGRGYVWEQGGRVYIIDEQGEKLPTPLINISEEVGNWGDHGLLGFALDPKFNINGYFYLLYVVDRHYLMNYGTPDYNPDITIENQATMGRITRYTADPDNDFLTAIPESRKVLLGDEIGDGPPILIISHGIGTLAFGEDGSLLASCGEGASFQTNDVGSAEETYFQQALDDGLMQPSEDVGAFRSQSLSSLKGKIWRLDPETGDGLASNPFYDPANPRSAASRVWALGLRNPFRFIVKAGTGEHDITSGGPGHILVGDVGANLWEETTAITEAGSNLGWPNYESFFEKWPFHWDNTMNEDLPNPLGADCDYPFYRFIDLIKEPLAESDPLFLNPCSTEDVLIDDETPTFVQTRPIVAWSNRAWNQPMRTFVPSFSPQGFPLAIAIDSTASTVEGEKFDGYSSIPGFFYEGDRYPEAFHGALLQADYSGWIKAFQLDENYNLTKVTTLLERGLGISTVVYNPIDEAIYYTDVHNQKIHKITYKGNPPPVVIAEVDKIFGTSPLTVNFNAEQSFSPYDAPLTFEWNFGEEDAIIDATGAIVSHTYEAPDNNPIAYTATLTVRDSAGLERQKEFLISLNNTPPYVNINSFEDGDFYSVNGLTSLPLRADVRDAEHSEAQLSYEWTVYLHHNLHRHAEASDNNVESEAFVEPLGCGLEDFWYSVELSVTDEQGLQNTDTKEIFPYCGDPITEIINLEAIADSLQVHLTWETDFEENISQFEVQKERPLSGFETIGIVEPNNSQQYTFTDTERQEGWNTYRIKALTPDRIFDYSNEVDLFFEYTIAFELYPNPADDWFLVDIKNPQTNLISIELFDNLGRLISTRKFATDPDTRFQETYDVSALSPAIYYYKISYGENLETGKIVVY